MIENIEFGRICIVGDLILDQYISGAVNRVSPEAPVPVLLHSDRRLVAGGAANVAANSAALGASVDLIGLIGADNSGRLLIDALKTWATINVDGIVSDPAFTTITKTRVVSGRQQIVRIDEESRSQLPSSASEKLIQQAEKAIERADILVCSDYAKGVLSDDVLRHIIRAARARGIPVIVDPKRKDLSIYQGATLITPNRAEIAAATNIHLHNEEDILRAAELASAQFGGDVLLTRSEDGMTLWRTNGEVTHVAAHRKEVSDVSGAGDTVVATVASILSARQSIETAVTIASTAAAISVSKIGTATVSRGELSRALRNELTYGANIASVIEAKAILDDWRHHGAQIVFTNGCFDLLHPGHIELIHAAAKQGDMLVVALNSDASVKRLKGDSRPIQDEQSRAKVMSALRDVDLVVIFEEDTPLELIKELRPDIIVKGSDYTEDQVVGRDFVVQYGGRVALVDLVSGHSTSALVKRANG